MTEVQEIRVIKRYANRKLYDTRDSKYVTLDRIAEFVRNGEEVKVIDSGNATAWSVQSLRGFIQQGREKLLSSLKDGPVGKLVGRAEELGAEVYSAADDRVRALLESATAHVKQLQGEVLRLQTRIEELEAKVRQGSPKDESPDSLE
jgi:predicted nuclease with TOPRIM domain